MAAVAARSEDRARAFAAQYGVEEAYGGYAEMLARADVDIVYIGTIDRLHKEHCLMAIDAGTLDPVAPCWNSRATASPS